MKKFIRKWLGIEESLKPEGDSAGGYFSTNTAISKQQAMALMEDPHQRTVGNDYVDANGNKITAAMDNIATTGNNQLTGTFSNISTNLYLWYASQSFIGYQACGIIAQQWLIERACSIKGRDAVRKGYKIIVDEGVDLEPKQLKYIERLDRKFKVKKNLERADKFKNVHGIRHVLFKVESEDPDYYRKPFNPDGIKPGSYKGMVQIEPYWITHHITAGNVDDPTSKDFYDPDFWSVHGKMIHKSHFVILKGPEVADHLKPTYYYGGISLTQRIMERIYSAERTANEAPQLTLTKRLNVLKTDIAKAVADQDSFEGNLQVMERFRDNYGTRVIGKNEEHLQIDTTLTDLDAVINGQYQIVSSIAGVPLTKLMKSPPKGFQSTGENEREDYHEELESIQENDLSAIVERHHLCLMRSHIAPRFKTQPFDISHEWNELTVMSDLDRSTIESNKSNATKQYFDMGAVDAYDVRDNLIADEKSNWTGLEKIDRPEEEPDMDAIELDIEQEKAGGEASVNE